MADSCKCMTKPTTILLSNKPPINKNKWEKKKRLEKHLCQTQIRLWTVIQTKQRTLKTQQ